MPLIPDDLLLFPSGKSVSEIKKQSKKLKKSSSLSQAQALRECATLNGIDLSWEKSLNQLRLYWCSWFAEFVFQEEPEYEVTVRIGGFDKQSATEFSESTARLRWIDGGLWFSANGSGDGVGCFHEDGFRRLQDYEVTLRVQKPETRNNIISHEADFVAVNIPVAKYPAYFGREPVSFSSLAIGTEQSPLLLKENASENITNVEADLYLEAVGLALRAKQYGHKLIQIKGVGERLHYIHTSLDLCIVASMLNLTKVFPGHLETEILVPNSTFSVVHLDSFDLSLDQKHQSIFSGLPCYLLDVSELPAVDRETKLSKYWWTWIKTIVELEAGLGYPVYNTGEGFHPKQICRLLSELEEKNTNPKVVQKTKEFLDTSNGFSSKAMASLLPLMDQYKTSFKLLNT